LRQRATSLLGSPAQPINTFISLPRSLLSFQSPNARARTTTVNLNFGHASSPHRTEHLSRLASLAPNTCRTERNREFKPPVREGRRWRPTIADARRDVRDEVPPDDEQRAANAVVTIGPVESQRPLWYAGPDLAAAAISGGEPRIVRAWRLRPHGTQETRNSPRASAPQRGFAEAGRVLMCKAPKAEAAWLATSIGCVLISLRSSGAMPRHAFVIGSRVASGVGFLRVPTNLERACPSALGGCLGSHRIERSL
jgi:hypothetical protein